MQYFIRHNRFGFLLSAIMCLSLAQEKINAATCPCDIYAAAGNPCVAAHSTVRLLLSTYTGPIYQVRRSSDNTTKDIYPITGGTIADGASQAAFCAGTNGAITCLYDQSGKGNDLWYQNSPQVPGSASCSPANAKAESLYVGGHRVYSLWINQNCSYWHNGATSGMPTGSQPEAMYMVTSGTHYNNQCCFDYGNSETDRIADGSGTMDALNLSAITNWGTGAGNGPWVMADLEYGIFSENTGGGKNQNDPSQTSKYVTAVLKNNGTSTFALRGGNAQSGGLTSYYNGALPSGAWTPMKKQGAIVLGSGGDCCKASGGGNLCTGTFYEGVIVSGYPADATENSVQANIVAAGYGNTSPVTWYDAGKAATAPLFKVNYHPSNGTEVISYTLQDARHVGMNIYNQQGRQIASVVSGIIPAGRHEAVWDAKRVPSGVYIVRISVDGKEGWSGKIIVGK